MSFVQDFDKLKKELDKNKEALKELEKEEILWAKEFLEAPSNTESEAKRFILFLRKNKKAKGILLHVLESDYCYTE